MEEGRWGGGEGKRRLGEKGRRGGGEAQRKRGGKED